jgi:hypothetical protein
VGIAFTVCASARLVTCLVENTPTDEDAREFFDVLLAHPDFECGFNLLMDCRKRTANPDPAFARAFSKEVRQRAKDLGPCRWAYVVTTSSGFAAVRLIALLTFGSWVEFASFMTMDEAAKWVEAGTAERRALIPSSC